MFKLDEAVLSTSDGSKHSMLQWKSELEDLCKFIIDNQVKSFLEIGCATGRLAILMKDALPIDSVFACDINAAPLLQNRPDIPFYLGNHCDTEYAEWRNQLGMIDMVFIDADHYSGFRQDYAIECRFPHRYIAFHDVANKAYPELRKFWESEIVGDKVTFLNRDVNCNFGVPEFEYPIHLAKSQEQVDRYFGRTCGIGIVAASYHDRTMSGEPEKYNTNR